MQTRAAEWSQLKWSGVGEREQQRAQLDAIAVEIQRVRTSEPLECRNLLDDLVPVLQKISAPMAESVKAALKELPRDPGFGHEGRMVNDAEKALLDAVQFGLQKPWFGSDGPRPDLMMWRLLRIGKDQLVSNTRDTSHLRSSAQLGWRLLHALQPWMTGAIEGSVKQRWTRPFSEPTHGADLIAAQKNKEAMELLFDFFAKRDGNMINVAVHGKRL